jgi:hypothetical protein
VVGDRSSPGSGRRPSHKISRDDILAHAYAQCRSNKGAPGIDGQDFADIEAYGVERWLAELALALRQGTYRPELSTAEENQATWRRDSGPGQRGFSV